MAKIGRNEPCPCGSGKKYKKCCLGKADPPSAVPDMDVSPISRPISDASLPPMSPYVLAKLFEESEHYAHMQRRQPKRARRYCTPGQVAVLSTEQIVARLRRLEVDARPEAYLALAATGTSAWAVSEHWREGLYEAPSRYDDDFLGIAACELWKRYCPERPSIEMLDDAMQAGYELMMQGERAKACERWAQVWQTIRERLLPQMRTTDSTTVVFDGTQSLYNWVQDYVLELHNAAVDDPRYAETGVRLCEEVLAQFPDEDALFVVNFRGDMGEFLCRAGDHEQGERVFLELIRDYPDTAAGYARLADLLGYGPIPDSEPIDRKRAQRVLEEALARPVTDAADYDLEARLSELRGNPPQPDQDPQPLSQHLTG